METSAEVKVAPEEQFKENEENAHPHRDPEQTEPDVDTHGSFFVTDSSGRTNEKKMTRDLDDSAPVEEHPPQNSRKSTDEKKKSPGKKKRICGRTWQ